MSWLTNKWMNETAFLAQAAHTLFGASVVLLAIVFANGAMMPVLATAGVFVVGYAAPKEFVYDARYELPPQTAADNWTDFAFLTLGALLGVGVFFLHRAIQ